MKTLVLGLFLLLVSGCSNPPVEEPAEGKEALFELDGEDLLVPIEGRRARVKWVAPMLGDELYLETDVALHAGGDGVTIEDLQWVAHRAPSDPRYDELLIKIFNEFGVSLSYLPRGFSAGRGAAIDLSEEVDASDVLEHLTGEIWQGKYFERPDQCLRLTRGANRIGRNIRVDFVARLIPQHLIDHFVESAADLDIRARSNYVDLNYRSTQPQQRREGLDQPNSFVVDSFPGVRRIAGLVERLGVYDLGVMIPGRNGPILVGRTWLGEYADNREQTYRASSLDGKQIAWFFLDFSGEALDGQDTPLLGAAVEYEEKETCSRRPASAELLDLPDPRPL